MPRRSRTSMSGCLGLLAGTAERSGPPFGSCCSGREEVVSLVVVRAYRSDRVGLIVDRRQDDRRSDHTTYAASPRPVTFPR